MKKPTHCLIRHSKKSMERHQRITPNSNKNHNPRAHYTTKKEKAQSYVSYSSSPEESTDSTDGVFLGCLNQNKLSDAKYFP